MVGNRGFDALPDVVRALTRTASRLQFDVAFDEDLLDLVPGAPELGSPLTLDAMVSLGGDGTMLRAARLLRGHRAPMLGINLGRLGFLTTCGADEMDRALERLAARDYDEDPRMTLDVAVLSDAGTRRAQWVALNDAVLHKGGFARLVRLRVTVDGESIGTYAADGLAISSPTGSTAYSLSAGGPVVVPTLESILITAISAHALAIRPLVIPPTAEVRVYAEDIPEELMVTVDGQVGTSFSGRETLAVRRGEHSVVFVRFRETTFFSRLRRKLGWGGLPDRDDESPC